MVKLDGVKISITSFLNLKKKLVLSLMQLQGHVRAACKVIGRAMNTAKYFLSAL